MIIKSRVSSFEITASLIYLTQIQHMQSVFQVHSKVRDYQRQQNDETTKKHDVRLCILYIAYTREGEKNRPSSFDQTRLAGFDARYLYRRTYTVTYTHNLCTRNDPLRVHACLHTAIGSFRYGIPLIRPRTKNPPVIIPPRLIATSAIYIHFRSWLVHMIFFARGNTNPVEILNALFLIRNS
jgi:hypothetical protein